MLLSRKATCRRFRLDAANPCRRSLWSFPLLARLATCLVFWRRHGLCSALMSKRTSRRRRHPTVGRRIEVETLINVRIAHAGLKVTEVPSYEHSRIHGLSNLNAARDGWRVLPAIFAERCYYHRTRAAQSKNPSEAPARESGLCG